MGARTVPQSTETYDSMPSDSRDAFTIWLQGGSSSIKVVSDDDGSLSLEILRASPCPVSQVRLRGVRGHLRGQPTSKNADWIALKFGDGASMTLKKIDDGLVEVEITGANNERAVEASFVLRDLGPCFGLGHLMRQPWPLQDGALELGPFYVSKMCSSP